MHLCDQHIAKWSYVRETGFSYSVSGEEDSDLYKKLDQMC